MFDISVQCVYDWLAKKRFHLSELGTGRLRLNHPNEDATYDWGRASRTAKIGNHRFLSVH